MDCEIPSCPPSRFGSEITRRAPAWCFSQGIPKCSDRGRPNGEEVCRRRAAKIKNQIETSACREPHRADSVAEEHATAGDEGERIEESWLEKNFWISAAGSAPADG